MNLMNEHWAEALQTSTPKTSSAGIKLALCDFAVCEVSGSDALSFLHGQLCADLNALGEQRGVLTAWCSPKGRVLFLVTVLRQADRLWLLVPAGAAENLVRRLNMFVLRADVQLSDKSADYAAIQVFGDELNEVDADVRHFTDGGTHWLLAPGSKLAETWRSIDVEAAVGGSANRALIDRGIPTLDAQLSDQFLPQELNLDQGAGLSFDKGCYPGQEIIARVKFRGAVKRRLARMHANSGDAPEPGAEIVTADTAEKCGTVLSAATRPDDSVDVLAVLNVNATDTGFRLAHEPGLVLSRLDS